MCTVFLVRPSELVSIQLYDNMFLICAIRLLGSCTVIRRPRISKLTILIARVIHRETCFTFGR